VKKKQIDKPDVRTDEEKRRDRLRRLEGSLSPKEGEALRARQEDSQALAMI
jgi:hypothetical protein